MRSMRKRTKSLRLSDQVELAVVLRLWPHARVVLVVEERDFALPAHGLVDRVDVVED